jgi:NAD(P)-dependent dehydrogenase (short-subunit alcohol dehydrogenase family)
MELMMKPLTDKIAVVAGATRGAGRGIACMLGELGATVYCTGRSVRGKPAMGERPETIEETAEMVNSFGGVGIYHQADHTDEAQVIRLFERVRGEFGRLDILINDIWGGEKLTEWGVPFWELNWDKGRTLLERAIHTHIITARHGVPLMVEKNQGLIIEVTDGTHMGYRGNLFYDLSKLGAIRMAYNMSEDLKDYTITALAVTPGFLRSEEMLDYFGVTEENWRDGVEKEKHFIASETPYFVGRAIAALAADPNVHEKAGEALASGNLAKEYGIVDMDGRRPDWGTYYKEVVVPEMNE